MRPILSPKICSSTAFNRPRLPIRNRSRLAPNSCNHGRKVKDTTSTSSQHILTAAFLSKSDTWQLSNSKTVSTNTGERPQQSKLTILLLLLFWVLFYQCVKRHCVTCSCKNPSSKPPATKSHIIYPTLTRITVQYPRKIKKSSALD